MSRAKKPVTFVGVVPGRQCGSSVSVVAPIVPRYSPILNFRRVSD